jgi:predicted aldo/keto reductase-like oxidoreductase
VALACKTGQTTAEGARADLARSLRRLKTDHFELYQYHGFTRIEQAEEALGPGGAIEEFEAAKEQGLTRLIGFSAHHEEAALMAINSGRFDTMLMPLNYSSLTKGGYPRRALAAANERGMGVLALKAMARGPVPDGRDRPYPKCWYDPEDDPPIAELLLRFTLDLPGVAAAIPPGDPRLFRTALDCADRLTPLDDEARRRLEQHFADTPPLFPQPE